MATNNQVNVGLSGSTGTGTFVGSTSPTLVTPTLGAATGTTLTFSPTTGGIVGTTTNDNTTAGDVGEIIESTVLIGAAVSVTTATPKDITTITLTAGDWDVWGNVWTNPNGATITQIVAPWINTASATVPTAPGAGAYQDYAFTTSAGAAVGVPVGMRRLSLSGNTTVYLSVSVQFITNVNSAYGYIGARRRR